MNMATKTKEQEVRANPSEQPVTQAIATVEAKDVSDLFRRAINTIGPTRTLSMRRVLTRPLVSMSRRKKLAVEVQSEMYLMDLPLKGRSGGMGATRVFDATELVPTEHGFAKSDEVIVLCHEVMCSAIGRAGYASKGA